MKVAFITAIFNGSIAYERSCKPHVQQTVPASFICFSNANPVSNGWTINNTPWHYMHPSPLDGGQGRNSLAKNTHIFNIAKYYKQAWRNIPILAEYDVVIWLDATVEITDPNCTRTVLQALGQSPIATFEHDWRNGCLKDEVVDSLFDKYTSPNWMGQLQPVQPVVQQYAKYVARGYREDLWRTLVPERPSAGVYLTCFVAVTVCPQALAFMDAWYLETLHETTQDQISFPYVLQQLNIIPYAWPNEGVIGEASTRTTFYIKHNHGR